MKFNIEDEVKILRGPKANTIATVVGYSSRGLILKVRGHKDTFTVKESNVEPASLSKVAPDWPEEGWESWLP